MYKVPYKKWKTNTKRSIFLKESLWWGFLYINQEFLIYFMTLMGHLAVGTLLSKYIHVIFSMVTCLPNKCSAEMRK